MNSDTLEELPPLEEPENATFFSAHLPSVTASTLQVAPAVIILLVFTSLLITLISSFKICAYLRRKKLTTQVLTTNAQQTAQTVVHSSMPKMCKKKIYLTSYERNREQLTSVHNPFIDEDL